MQLHPFFCMRYICCILLVITSVNARGAHFKLDSLAQESHKLLFEFKLNSAKELIKKAQFVDVNNVAYQYFDLYADFLSLANSPTEDSFEKYKKKEKRCLERLGKLKNSDPYKNYAKAEILFRSGFMKLYFGDYFSGGNNIRKSYKLLEVNKRNHPKFYIQNKTYGLIQVFVGSIPKKYKIIQNLTGMEGDVEKGIRLMGGLGFLKKVKPEHELIARESRLIYAFVQLFLKENESLSWKIIKKECKNYRTNIFENYLLSLMAMETSKNDIAVKVLKVAPKKPEVAIPFMNLMYGITKLRKLDFSAETTLKEFVTVSQNKSNKYTAYKLLAWSRFLQNDDSGYKKYLKKARSLFDESKINNDFDVKENVIQHKLLLKARLLQDGGYLTQAMNAISGLNEKNFKTTDHKVEWYYRMGRIQQEAGDTVKALKNYKSSIHKGGSTERYFPRNAAFESAVLLKELGRIKESKTMLNLAIKGFPNSKEYESGIKQKAMALLESY
jgi:hypothetical protein